MRSMILLVLGLVAGLTIRADGVDTDDVVAPEPLTFDVARHGTATVEDGYRVFAMLAQEQGRLTNEFPAERMTFAELQSSLDRIGLSESNGRCRAGDALRRDVVAYMSVQYLGIRPGLLNGLFGVTRRYAYREMQHRELMVAGNPKTIVSGSELLSVVTRVALHSQPDGDVSLTQDEIH